MKAAKTLSELAAELERQVKSKRDYIAPTSRLAMRIRSTQPDSNPVVLEGVNGGMPLKTLAHGQLSEALGIPKKYYERMLTEMPDLLCKNVNGWLGKEAAKGVKKMVRTLDGNVRAILTDSYRPLENFDLAEAVIPKLVELEADVVSAELTETRMYIKAVTPKVQAIVAKIKPGLHQFLKPGVDDDIIQAGAVISNSEVGHGRIKVQAMTYRLACYNGAIHETAIAKTHVGRDRHGNDDLEGAREYFRTETRIADDKAFFMKLQDATAAMFSEARFMKRIDQYREAADRIIPATLDPVDVVEVTAKRFDLEDGERKSVLKHLIQGGDLSAWGMANAFTRTAADVDSYDRSTELEALGGQIVELSRQDWDRLVKV